MKRRSLCQEVWIQVRAYESVLLAAWRSRGTGASAPTCTLRVEHSADMAEWHTVGSEMELEAGVESVERFSLSLEGLRVRVQLGGDGLTVYAVGDFEPREEMGHGEEM
jgi:hypothetical protein